VVRVEILAVGNELLLGDVLDTNTNWLCRKITGLGGTVTRAALVRDDVQAIAHEIEAALERQPDLVFTVGGMGPTADDMTLEAIALATGRPLQLDHGARDFVTRRYVDFAREGYVDDASMTPAREKMAYIPTGAIPVDNPVGAAPAVVVRIGPTTCIALPGVPREMIGIFEGSLPPRLQEIFGEGVFAEKTAVVDSKDESELAPLLKAVSDRNPSVYIKSRPQRFGQDVKIQVTVSMAGKSVRDVGRGIDKAVKDLADTLSTNGISIDSVRE
jgi:nicotinamide-nucleotide amidase